MCPHSLGSQQASWLLFARVSLFFHPGRACCFSRPQHRYLFSQHPPPPQFYLNCVTHQGAKLCQSPFRTGPPVHQPMGDYLNPHTSLPLGCYSSTCLGPPQPPCRTTKLNWYVTYSPETHSHTQWVALMSPGSTSSKDYGFPLAKGAKPRGGGTPSQAVHPQA